MSEETNEPIVDETPTSAEREEQVLENAGVETKMEDGVYKVNLGQPQETEQTDAVQEQETEDGVLRGGEQSEESGQEAEVELQEVREEAPVVEEVTEAAEPVSEESQEEVTRQDVVDQVAETPGMDLPENIQKVVDFMNETGGTLEDYVRLNANYDDVDNNTLLKEYYKQNKPHLSNDEIDFLIEDKFSYDEDIDDERDVKRKKLAFKEEVAEAKSFLNNLKDKYYDEVKLNSRLNPEQQKAIDFFNRYNQEQSELAKMQEQASERFKQETNKVFNENFKGFDFSVGEKKYRFNVKDVEGTKEAQSDLFKAFSNYVSEDNSIKDAQGYHKALFAARNADSIANHFYEQGKADAIRQINAESKNINMDPRKNAGGVIETGGVKVRAVAGEDSSKLKIKLKQ
jgi:hypothetical protein